MIINNTISTTILIDTYCDTGCKYCELATRKQNIFKYPYNIMDSYMDIVKPSKIVIFGGDTFYNHDNIRKAYNYACSLSHVNIIASISEIQKIDKDYDIRKEMVELCMSNNKVCGVSFSLDIDGKKTGNYVNTLNRFYNETNAIPNFDSVITTKHINNNGIESLRTLIDIYNSLTFETALNIKLDYNAITTNDIDHDKVIIFIDELVNIINNNRNNKLKVILPRNNCSVRGGRSDLIKQDGTITLCGKTNPNYEMDPIKVWDIKTIDDYDRLKNIKYSFRLKTYNNICAECPANVVCCRCPKFVKLVDGNVGDKDTCVFYKKIYEIFLKNKLDWMFNKRIMK